MKLVLIADTHSLHRKVAVPDGDILIHAGDMTNVGDIHDVVDFAKWMQELPHKHKVVVAGNHDFCFENSWSNVAKGALADAGIVYLHDSGCEIAGLSFWGSPYTPVFMQWAFMRKRGSEILRHWDLIPNHTDILITHGPPMGLCDRSSPSGENLGCADLRDAVDRIRPRLSVFGHIHGGAGGTIFAGGCLAVNASVVDEAYRPVNKVTTIELAEAEAKAKMESLRGG